jgi:O-Antigen ligase
MGTGTPATALKPRARRPVDGPLLVLGAVGAGACVVATIALAASHVAGGGLPAIGAVGFLLLVGWCFAHRRVDHTLAALGLYLGLLDGYIKLSTGSSTITLARDVIVLAISGGALLRSMRSEQRLALPPLGGLVVAFCVLVFVELANPSSRGLAAGFAGVRQHLEFVPLFFLGYAFLRRGSQLRTLLFILVLCAAIGGVVSYIQSTLTPAQLAGWGPGYAERVFGTGEFAGAGRVGFGAAGAFVRPFGLGSDSGSGAVAAALALPGLIALMMRASGRVRLALVPLSIGIALAVVTSGSRAALITVFVSVAAFGLIAAASKNAMRAVIGLAVGVAIIFVAFQQLGPGNALSERAQSVAPSKALSTFSTERGASVGEFWSLAAAHPLGAGVGWSGPAAGFHRSAQTQRFNSETQWNFLVIELGIAGILIYLALNLRLMSLALVRIRRVDDPGLRLNLAALAAPLFALVVAGFAGATTATVPSAPYIWLVAGLLSYWLGTGDRVGEKAAATAATFVSRRGSRPQRDWALSEVAGRTGRWPADMPPRGRRSPGPR